MSAAVQFFFFFFTICCDWPPSNITLSVYMLLVLNSAHSNGNKTSLEGIFFPFSWLENKYSLTPVNLVKHLTHLSVTFSVTRYIRSMNMKGNLYHLTVNHFADMTDAEFQSHKGLMPGDGDYGSRDYDDNDDYNDDDRRDGRNGHDYRDDEKRSKIEKKNKYGHVPKELDWRKYGMHI